MKKLNQYISEAERDFGITKYITEKFRLSKDNLKELTYNYHPQKQCSYHNRNHLTG